MVGGEIMPTTLDLINLEKIASIIFIISSFLSLFSAFKAEQVEVEKQQGIQTSPGSSTAVTQSTKLGLDATKTAVLAYIIFFVVAVLRKNQLEQEIQAGTTSTSTIPNIFIITGFFIAILGGILRVPAIEQRLKDASRPVIL